MTPAQRILLLGRNRRTVLYDTFTGADTTALSSHNLNISPAGGAWTNLNGTNTILGNQAICTAVPTLGSVKKEAGISDGIITADVTCTTSAAAVNAGIYARCVDENNGWRIGFRDSGLFQIIKRDAGVQTTTQTAFTFVDASVYKVEVTLNGSAVIARLFLAGVQQGSTITVIDSFQQGITTHGLQWGDTYAVEAITIDNFLMTTL